MLTVTPPPQEQMQEMSKYGTITKRKEQQDAGNMSIKDDTDNRDAGRRGRSEAGRHGS